MEGPSERTISIKLQPKLRSNITRISELEATEKPKGIWLVRNSVRDFHKIENGSCPINTHSHKILLWRNRINYGTRMTIKLTIAIHRRFAQCELHRWALFRSHNKNRTTMLSGLKYIDERPLLYFPAIIYLFYCVLGRVFYGQRSLQINLVWL